MLSLDEALERVLAVATALPSEVVALADAHGRVLAEDVLCLGDLPAFDYSAMDGYALCTESLTGSGPWQLLVSSESRAGQPAQPLEPGTASRIFTGAPVPLGADSVIMQENTTREGQLVSFTQRPAVGEHIRRKGEDLKQGTVALGRGRRLGAFELGFAAALDRGELAVARRPKVTVLCTGDELRAPGSPGRPGTIPESNSIVVTTLARLAGAAVVAPQRVEDELALVTAALRTAAETSDVIVTIGGASVGDHDLVRQGLSEAGANVDFWKVRIKPGKPFVLGTLGSARVLGLPGNPVSAQLTFMLFGLPLLRAMQGLESPLPARQKVRLGAPIRQKRGRLGLYRARLEGDVAVPQVNQASGSTASLAAADVVVIVPETSEGIAAGELAEAFCLPLT